MKLYWKYLAISYLLCSVTFLFGQVSPHQYQHKLLQNDSLHAYFNAKGPSQISLKKLPGLTGEYEVFGWYPYWDGNYYKELNYKLVSTVAFFAHEVDPSSGHLSVQQTSLIQALCDSTKKHGHQFLLTASNFGGTDNKKLLTNEAARNQLIQELLAINSQYAADGICLNFEAINGSEAQAFASFVSKLKKALLGQSAKNKLYITIPAVDWTNSLKIDSLLSSVDRFVMMGYNYYSAVSSKAGPNSPLSSGSIWASHNLETSIKYYLDHQIPAGSLILGLPFYGQGWQTSGPEIPSAAQKYLGNMTYSYIRNHQLDGKQGIYSQSAYKVKQNTTGSYDQYWYEGDSSFQVKLALITENKLAGLGIWALGFDAGYHDLWATIVQGLTSNDPTKIKDLIAKDSAAIKADTGVVWKKITQLEQNLEGVVKYQQVLLITFGFLAVFGALGILLGLLYPQTRLYFFSRVGIRNLLLIGWLAVCMCILQLTGMLSPGAMTLFYGFMAGAIGYYFIQKYKSKREKELP
ncbi:MAG: glycoside hydrolase family 18 protein [Bacteroidetes bacterium]|nr:MAG: glycoside hydrolase family 18 protein [Bacteroidota bacterium]